MCVRHTQQLKVFLPIRTLLGEWGRTETNFDPMYFFVIAAPSMVHVVEIFIAGDRTLPQRP